MKPEIFWDDWIRKNEGSLQEGFELQFAQKVLRRVQGIKPEDVIPQAPWKDAQGVNRRFDFRISVPTRGINVAIELDGAEKDTDTRRWMKFLDRQNDALLEVPVLLRFSNRKLFTEDIKIVRAIERVIEEQAKSYVEQNKLRSLLQSMEAKIHLLQTEIAATDSKVIVDLEGQLQSTQHELREAQDNLDLLRTKLEGTLDSIPDPLEEVMKPIVYILGAIALFAVGVIAFIAVDGRQPRDDQSRVGTTSQAQMDQGDVPAEQEIRDQRSAAPSVVDSQSTPVKPRSMDGSSQRAAYNENRIAAINAPLYVGRSVIACGCAVEVKSQPTRTVINLDRPFPNQPLYLNVWSRNLGSLQAKFGDLAALTGSTVCGVGTVKLYKNMANIEIRSAANLRLLRQECVAN